MTEEKIKMCKNLLKIISNPQGFTLSEIEKHFENCSECQAFLLKILGVIKTKNAILGLVLSNYVKFT